MVDNGLAMIVKTRTVSILAPDNLLGTLKAFLESAPDMHDSMGAGTLTLSSDPGTKADMLLAPSLESALQWGYNRDIHWPMAIVHASNILGQLSDIATRDGVVVIREEDLESRPNLVLQTIAERLGFSRSAEIENPHDPKISHIAHGDMPPLNISPLRMYSEIPVLRDMWAHWPSFLFWTYDGPCPTSIDVMGRARLLFYGPFIVLAPGTWRVDLVFELTDEAVPYDYYIEIGAAHDFERIVYRPETAGEQIIGLQYTARACRNVEIKVGLLRAAFHGELKLKGAWVAKLD